MSEHYICDGGCKGVSEKAGVCGAEDCPKFGHDLKECNCEDMQHDGAFKADPDEDIEAEPVSE